MRETRRFRKATSNVSIRSAKSERRTVVKDGRFQKNATDVIVRSTGGYNIKISVRRVRIDPGKKREEFLDRLDAAISKIEAILNSENSSEAIKIQAANTLSNILRVSYTIVRDIDIENVEREISEIEESRKKQETEHLDFAPPRNEAQEPRRTATVLQTQEGEHPNHAEPMNQEETSVDSTSQQ